MSLLLLAGCMAAPRGEGRCTPKPAAIVRTHGAGAEDMVALPLSDGRTRLFVREVCRGWWGCGPDQYRIGRVDIGPGTTSEHTEMAWRPPSPEFRPLGMSLLPGNQPGSGVLFVLDAVEPLRIWRLAIEKGDIAPAEGPWFTDREHALEGANDIQAIGDVAYVTRYDPYGFLPWRSGSWPGVVEVHEDGTWVAHADGLRGANGIINPGRGRSLVVSSYWERRLRFVGEDAHDRSADGHATAELPIHPDNLTLDGPRILIAGQRHPALVALNVAAPFVLSPSAVLEIGAEELQPQAEPRLRWNGGWSYGRSVSVAVPVPGGLALGQVRAPDILRVQCPEG